MFLILFSLSNRQYNSPTSLILGLWGGSVYKGERTALLHLHHAAEAHEGHSEDAGGDEGDGNALHRGGQLGA